MRIQFERSGGVTGMRVSATIDTDSLSPEQAGELQELVDSCDFFDLSIPGGGAAGGADRFQYRIAIESEGRQRTVDVGEDSAPDSMRPLLRRLTVLARSSK